MKNSNSNNPSNAAIRLSYSSMKTLQSCEQKYHHYKVSGTPKDSDVVESNAMALGSAYHHVLENSMHTDKYDDSHILAAMAEHEVDGSDKDLLTVMLKKYVEFRKASGYKIIKCELAISTQEYTGFIDFIAVKGNEFFIGDLKTAARFDETLLSRLPMDSQLNLYAHFADQVDIAVPEVKDLRFAGCLYNQATKSKAGTISGLEKGVKIYETFIPAEVMDPDVIWSIHSEMHDRARELHAGEAPRKNFAACFDYFRPCEYFSKCYGSNFTENYKKVKLTTIETIKEEDELL